MKAPTVAINTANLMPGHFGTAVWYRFPFKETMKRHDAMPEPDHSPAPGDTGEHPPFVAPCRQVPASAPFGWLAAGWRDMRAAPGQSLGWGLVVLVYRECLGVELPQYLGYGSVDEHAEIAALIAGAEASPLWRPVPGVPAPFDVAVFRRGRWDSHLGLIVQPGLMLHMEGEDCAKLVRIDTGRWASRLRGVFRPVAGVASRPVDDPVQGAVP
jgi:hypothetical protein